MLIDSRDRLYMITLKPGKEFHSHQGMVAHDELIGSPEGTSVTTARGSRMVVLRPTLAEYILKMKRGAQVVYPKDIGLIIVYADIFPGAKVIEAGTGSGSLTLGLARAVGETGRVVSYELRDDHHANAKENIEAWYSSLGGKPDQVELRVGDIYEGLDERGFDRMVLDLPEPWKAIGTATASLASGGILCCYLPTIPQIEQVVAAMRRADFGSIATFEGLIRTWNVDGQSVRPDHRMVGHTGFIVTARKLAPAAGPPNAPKVHGP